MYDVINLFWLLMLAGLHANTASDPSKTKADVVTSVQLDMMLCLGQAALTPVALARYTNAQENEEKLALIL